MSRPEKEKMICRMPAYRCFAPGDPGQTDKHSLLLGVDAVSYTHLDVYKRQV